MITGAKCSTTIEANTPLNKSFNGSREFALKVSLLAEMYSLLQKTEASTVVLRIYQDSNLPISSLLSKSKGFSNTPNNRDLSLRVSEEAETTGELQSDLNRSTSFTVWHKKTIYSDNKPVGHINLGGCRINSSRLCSNELDYSSLRIANLLAPGHSNLSGFCDSQPLTAPEKNNNDKTPGVLSALDIPTDAAWSVDQELDHPAIIKAISYMLENYRDTFAMSDLANACYVSPSHLTYLFKNRFGLSFKKILMHIRIYKATKIIKAMPVRQITLVSKDVGFCDLSHFEKTFKKYTGLSPSAYRKQFRKEIFSNSV